MINDIKSFVILKYPMITSDSNTWNLCEKYPESVNKKWALRCARDGIDIMVKSLTYLKTVLILEYRR